MSRLRELFISYGGDYDKTMRRFMNNEGLYYKLLPKLFQDESLSKLEKSIKIGDLETGFESAHTLKGISANLGLTPLYDSVCKIVEPLRNQQQDVNYFEMYQEIQQEFHRVRELWAQLEKGEKM